MRVLQWSMTIPKNKQVTFLKWFNEIAGPTFAKFEAVKHEIYKVEDKQIVGRQTIEEDKFIERVYFNDSFDIPSYFAKVKEDEKAWKESRKYEQEFGATNIELRVLSTAN